MKKQAQENQEEIDEFFEYDNLHEIAVDELDLTFQSISVKLHPNELSKH